MSGQCSHFVQNAWKKELCSNCFKPREEHAAVGEAARPNIGRKTLAHLKTSNHKVQGILRIKESCHVRLRKKNVAFVESLTEIIGYGGDDFSDSEDDFMDVDGNEGLNPEDDVPDSEEERALSSLTRANTNFNTVTANLNGSTKPDANLAKSFASLMLGKAQKDADGKKTTLLVSVRPFGGDDSLPTARRPIDRIKKCSEVIEDKSKKNMTKDVKATVDGHLEKIVDMPLIKSSRISVAGSEEKEMKKVSDSCQNSCETRSEKKTCISRAPAIKKPDAEKPRIAMQNSYIVSTHAQKLVDLSSVESENSANYDSGIELTLTPLKGEECDNKMEEDANKTSLEKSNGLRVTEVENLVERKNFHFEESRELAGEPDGKADEEDHTEPFVLKQTLPDDAKPFTATAEPRVSFLHGESKVKPTVPQKPTSKFGASLTSSVNNNLDQNMVLHNEITKRSDSSEIVREEDPVLEPEREKSRLGQDPQTKAVNVEPVKKPTDEPPSQKLAPVPSKKIQDEEMANEEDEDALLHNKRRMAPKPPAGSPVEDVPPPLFARNPTIGAKSDCPVVREKEKRERASSCSPKFRKEICEMPDPCAKVPEPAPRRNISLSQDSLANSERTEEKKKTRSRFSLKKFLRMGSRKDVDMTVNGFGGSRMDEIPTTPQPKPRLEIIHPLELDGHGVQVLGNDGSSRTTEDVTDSKSDTVHNPHSSNGQHIIGRPTKPPPPPRNQSLEEWSRLEHPGRPMRPPPPRTDTKLPPRSDKLASKAWQPSGNATSDSIYANLAEEDVTGEVRSALAPSKPQRTASMRDQTVTQPVMKKRTPAQGHSQNFECLGSCPASNSDSPTSSDQAYECLSSSPECDSSLELRHGNGHHLNGKRKSDSSAIEPNAEFKYHHPMFTRSTSLLYCGSETESELYAPYNFYIGDEGPEEDQDWKSKGEESRVSRLRQRRGRSIVHRSLEDNYGAVVVANHEALAQFLEQLNQTTPISIGLRGLKTTNPRFSDFHLDTTNAVPVGKRIFYPATWNDQTVTVCVSFDATMHDSKKEFYLAPIIEFIDAVPQDICERMNCHRRKNMEATISIFPRLQVNTIQSFATSMKDPKDDSSIRESSFILLQFLSALKNLQARGIEDAPKNLSNVVLCREDKDACYRLYLLQGLNIDNTDAQEEQTVSLCQCALLTLEQLNLAAKFPLIRELLMREKAVTLSQVKSVLEFSLWGPADATLGGIREREIVLQRWLDLERATVLHALVRAKAPLTVTDEYQLLFLVRTSAKIMCEASLHLDKQRNGFTTAAT